MKRVAKPLLTGVLLFVAAGIGVRAFYATRSSEEPAVATAEVTRGPIVDVVSASGTLQAVTTVQVGTQVSGTVSWLGADFNSIVRKGQVIARLDPSLFETQVEQSRANLTKASADLDNAEVKVTVPPSRTLKPALVWMTGASLTGVTVTMNVVLVEIVPSLTVTVIVEKPDC